MFLPVTRFVHSTPLTVFFFKCGDGCSEPFILAGYFVFLQLPQLSLFPSINTWMSADHCYKGSPSYLEPSMSEGFLRRHCPRSYREAEEFSTEK